MYLSRTVSFWTLEDKPQLVRTAGLASQQRVGTVGGRSVLFLVAFGSRGQLHFCSQQPVFQIFLLLSAGGQMFAANLSLLQLLLEGLDEREKERNGQMDGWMQQPLS